MKNFIKIISTMIFGLILIYSSINISMQYVRNDVYNIPWFDTWFYSPREFLLQLIFFQKIFNHNLYSPEILKAANYYKWILLGSFMLSTFIACFLFIYINKKLKKNSGSNRYGDAKWANYEEIKQNGLLDGEGPTLGMLKYKRNYYYIQYKGTEPIIGIGPTRSGKGTGWVITTLLKWKSSVIVYDPKGENWDLTAHSRRNDLKNKCLRFAPNEYPGHTKYKNCRFNFLDYIKYGTLEEVAHAETIASIICDTGDIKKDYWEDEAKSFIQAVILHILYTKANGNLTDVAFFVSRPAREILLEMIETDHAQCLRVKHYSEDQVNVMINNWNGITNSNIKSIAEAFYGMLSGKVKKPGDQFKYSEEDITQKGAEGQLHGVIGGAKRFLNIYKDPIVAYNISNSDFKIEDLYNYIDPVSLYIVVPPSSTQQARLRPITRLFCSLILDKAQSNLEPKRHKVKLIIDEFATLKKMSDVEDAFSTVSGYGLELFILLQDLKQLEKFYGQNETIYSNSPVRAIYSTSDPITKKRISEDSGKFTFKGQVISETSSGGVFSKKSITKSIQETPKSLITPDEVEKLASNEMLIFIRGMNPIKCYKANYLKDPELLAKTKVITYESDILNENSKLLNTQDNPLSTLSNNPKRIFKDLKGFTKYVASKAKRDYNE